MGGSDRGVWRKLLMVFRASEEGSAHEGFFEFAVFLSGPEGCR